ncbi:MAG: sugar phosphate isomerase/epimerase [Dysosmobacter sp.]|uniref:sugar phosphate isomerase/epimerase family protein n=1 Tax=uncultured Oscillibacter sp. TaxID=876091 RepID=UPI0026397D2A|nr:sugar phosphate isomerase/epimerase family protein [uncultured Oscillibacter sp.]MCX4373394.1 sugar phosphate isomerase/epimerase [Dysosmobacter sp.]
MSGFKFGACEWSFPCWGALALKMAREAGFTGMQLGDAGGSLHAYPLTDRRVQEHYLEAASKYGIELQSIHLYTLGHQGYVRHSPDSPEGRICRESIEKGIIAAHQMGIPTVIVDGMRMNTAAKRRHVFEMERCAAEIADAYGVNIAMETDMTLEEHVAFLDGLGGRVTLCFDTHNPMMYGTGKPADLIRALGKERIDHFHMKESRPNEDGYITVETPIVLLGQGITEFRESVEAIQEIGYSGWIISENFYYRPNLTCGGEDPVDLARRDVETLQAAFGTE